MEFNIVNELNGKFKPIALIKSDEIPENAICPKPGKGGCVMAFVSQTIAKRKITAFGRKNISCGGVATGLGWGDGFDSEEAMQFQATFLSLGADSAKDREKYLESLEDKPANIKTLFGEGERIYCDYDTALAHIKSRPVYDDKEYVIFKPIELLDENEIPDSVVFTLNTSELMAMLQLNGSFRTKNAYVITPQAAACQAIGSFTFQQRDSDDPVPVLSPIDFAARSHMRHFIPDDYMCLSMPWNLFLKLDELSKNSIFQTHLWKDW